MPPPETDPQPKTKGIPHVKSFLASALLAASALSAAADPDPLWLKAVDVASASRRWIAGEIRTSEQELDRKGNVKSSQDYVSSVRLGPDGKLLAEHWRIENGNRVPHVDDEDDPDDSSDPSVGFGPLDAECQPFVRVDRLPGTTIVGGAPCAEYSFELAPANDPSRLRGSVRIDERSGIPLRISFSPEPLPDDVKSLSVDLSLVSPDGLSVRPFSMTTDVSATVFFMTKKIRLVQEFGSFWLAPESHANP